MKRKFRLGGSLIGCILLISQLLTSCIQGGDIGGASGSLGESDSGSYVISSEVTDEITSEDLTTNEFETTETTETTGQEENSGTDGTSVGAEPSFNTDINYGQEGENALSGYDAGGSKVAFVVDVEKREVIYLKGDSKERVYPASITKLVTALVALEYCPKETVFTVGAERNMVMWDSSVAGLRIGDKLTLDDLLYCLLLPSGGDAAYTIAAGVGRMISGDESMSAEDAVAIFILKMNEFAKEIGMEGTVYTCPDGYHDDGHYMTAEDLIKLGVYCIDYGNLFEYTSVSKKTVTLINGRSITLKNSNPCVDEASQYYRENVDGLKTGTTDEAGNCLMASGTVNGKRYLVGAFNAKTKNLRTLDVIRAFDALAE